MGRRIEDPADVSRVPETMSLTYTYEFEVSRLGIRGRRLCLHAIVILDAMWAFLKVNRRDYVCERTLNRCVGLGRSRPPSSSAPVLA